MKVNRNYYPTENDIEVIENDRTIMTLNGVINYNNYPANVKIDESIAYVKSKSDSLPYGNLEIITPSVVVAGSENSTQFYHQKFDFELGNYVNLMLSNEYYNQLITQQTDISKPDIYGLPSYNGTKSYEWGYNIDTSTTEYNLKTQRLATGFDFRSICGYVYIQAYSDEKHTKGFNGYFSEWDSTAYPYVSYVGYYITTTKYNTKETLTPIAQLSFKNYDFAKEKEKYNDDYQKSDNTSLSFSSLASMVSGALGTNVITLFGGVGSYTTAIQTTLMKHPQHNYCYPFFFVRGKYITNIEFYQNRGQYNDFYISSNIITKKLIEEWANAFGLYWAEDLKTAQTADLGKDCTNPKVHLPVIDENGVTTGKSETGKNTTKLPQSGWTNPSDVFDKNPVRPDDDNDYTTKQELNKPSVSPIGSFTRTYAISGENVKLLSDKIWSGDDTAFKTFIDGLALMGENPINSIIDIRFYPFEIPNLGNTNKIVLGRNNTGIVGYPLASVDNNIITFGTAKIMEKYNCFLDYPPYTKAELVIPNVGSIELDLTKVMGKNIKLQVIVDYVTGACTAVVFADNTIIHTLAGTIAIEVPITGTNSAQYASSVTNSLLSLPSSIGSAATGISSGNAAQAVSGITGTIGAVGNIVSTPLPISSKNSATPMCSLFLPQYAYIRVTRPTFEEPDTYKSTFGYACNLTRRLGDMSGYVVCQNPIIENISATSDEINTIVQYLESGVII